MRFQTPASRRPIDRTDHVWFAVGTRFKCCLCGAVCFEPPPYPTPPNWVSTRFEELTDEERLLCPPAAGKLEGYRP